MKVVATTLAVLLGTMSTHLVSGTDVSIKKLRGSEGDQTYLADGDAGAENSELRGCSLMWCNNGMNCALNWYGRSKCQHLPRWKGEWCLNSRQCAGELRCKSHNWGTEWVCK
ncbi:hypothetical protein ACHAWF_008929 [Thalassiosira exigua]